MNCSLRTGGAALGIGVAFAAACPAADLSGTNDASIHDIITLVANRQLRTLADGDYTPVYSLSAAQSALKPTGLEWNYPWGVTLYGLQRVKDAVGDTNLLNFAITHNQIVGRYYPWLQSLKTTVTNASPTQLATFYNTTALGEFMRLGKLDYCGAMTAQLLESALGRSDGLTHGQAQAGLTTANYIRSTQTRRPDGTLCRTELGGTIWADDLYMSCPFLIRWYPYAGDAAFLDDAVLQISNIAGYLQDTDGLWFHGYFYNSNTNSGFKWGRANGWAMVATAEALSILPTNHPSRSNLLAILRRHIDAVKAVQAPSGAWRQVLNYPSLWEETSCTAMFTYSIARAVNRGWIDATNMAVARRGFVAVARNIDATGGISNTCAGTGIGTTLSFYNSRPRPYNDSHGIGAVMLAGAEILLRPELRIAPSNTHAVVSWNAGITNCALETGTNLTVWTEHTGSLAITNWEKLTSELAVDRDFFRLRVNPPVAPPAALLFEAEALEITTNGATASIAVNTNFSGGQALLFAADEPGDEIAFAITNVPAGSFRVKLRYQSGTDRAQVTLAVDGSPLGATLDEYWPATVYPLVDFGPATFAAPGDHDLRLTVTGRNAGSTNYAVSADAFIFAPR